MDLVDANILSSAVPEVTEMFSNFADIAIHRK